MEIALENGQKKYFKVLAKFVNEGINYIIYEDGDNILASRYEIINKEMILKPIENDKEWDMIDNFLDTEVYNG